MRILFDGMIPRPLARDLLPHVVSTIAQEGWGALTNGELLNAIGGRFDVLLTMDHNMAYQQKLTDRPFAVIELFAKRTTMEHIGPLLPELRSLIANAAPGTYYAIGNDQARAFSAIQRQAQQRGESRR